MITIREVTKVHYRGETQVSALRGVSCEMSSGTFNFIVGPSGSGKSTLLYLIGALDEPTSGEILINGERLGELSPSARDEYRRTRVGFIFQNFNLLGNLNAVDNVLVPYLPTGISTQLRKDAIDLLKQVGLGHRLDHRPGHLSGGEQQRVAIARALLKQPDLILADEPTGELDSQTGREIFGYLRQMHEERGATVVVVTHDSGYLSESDEILRMKDGLVDTALPHASASPQP